MTETQETQMTTTETDTETSKKKPKPVYQTTPIEYSEDDSQVRQWYGRLTNQVLDIDEKVDAGSEAATKRAITGGLVDAQKDIWGKAVDSITGTLERFRDGFENPETGEVEPGDMEKFVGVYLGVIRGLSNTFKDQVEAHVNSLVEDAPAPTDAPSAEEKAALMQERKELVGQINTIIEMAKTFHEFEESNPWYPPRRRGAVGARGKRALSYYTWTIDGQKPEEDDDSPAGVSKLLGFNKASEFTAALKAAGVNTTEPEPRFSVSINGKTVVAEDTRPEGESDEEEEENSEDSGE